MELEQILQSLRDGEQLSKEQVSYLMGSLSKLSAGESPQKGVSAEQFEAGLTSALDSLRKSPEGQAQLREAIAERKTQRFTKRYTPFFNAILAGADITSSLKQVRDSKNALRDLKRPGLPAIPGVVDPALDQSIFEAQRGTYDTARALAPAQQELQDQYGKDIALAKSVGGGQASTMGALGQVASLRRARGAASLVPIGDDIRTREQGRLDNLLGMRNSQVNQNYYNRFRNAQIGIDQYNQDAQAAGQLGSVGRLNMRNSMGNLLNSVPGVLARTGQGYGNKYEQYEQSLNNSLTGNAPTYSSNPDDPYNPRNITQLFTNSNYRSPYGY